eukprot:SAG11_NODE_1429_length_4936_cov_5.029539_4_plen_66_part_00
MDSSQWHHRHHPEARVLATTASALASGTSSAASNMIDPHFHFLDPAANPAQHATLCARNIHVTKI